MELTAVTLAAPVDRERVIAGIRRGAGPWHHASVESESWIALDRNPDGDQLTGAAERRRSTKVFSEQPLALSQLSDMLWFSAGGSDGRRPYASAHALYPVTLSVVAGAVEGLRTAMYRYHPTRHALRAVAVGDHRDALAGVTIDGAWITGCPAVLVFTADLPDVERHFAEQGPGRGTGFAWLETGLLSQNIYLWAAAHDVGTCFIGGIRPLGHGQLDQQLVPEGHTLLGVQPIGAARQGHHGTTEG